jgi:SAM-dependent methyltransferase
MAKWAVSEPRAGAGHGLPRACLACGQTRFTRAVALGSASVYRCAACGLGETVPAPAEADGRETFAADPAYFAAAYGQAKDRWWRRFTEAPLDCLEAAGARPGLGLLDVGCNLGYLVAAARARGYRARGFDASPAAVAFGRDRLGLDLACARIDAAPVTAAGEDIVVLNHVLEHLPDPRGALARARGWLRPEGFLLVALPNFASPIARWTGPRWSGLVPTQHIWHLTPAALVRLVGDAGFTRSRWWTRMLTYGPRSPAEWAKWGARRVLEPLGRADNLVLVARPGGPR